MLWGPASFPAAGEDLSLSQEDLAGVPHPNWLPKGIGGMIDQGPRVLPGKERSTQLVENSSIWAYVGPRTYAKALLGSSGNSCYGHTP